MGQEMPVCSISWEYSENTPFIRGVRDAQVSVLLATLGTHCWLFSVGLVL